MRRNSAGADHPLKDFYADIYGTYDRVNRIFTFGRDRSWRKKAALECLEGSPQHTPQGSPQHTPEGSPQHTPEGSPQHILDVCTGTGDFLLEMASLADGNTIFTGYDFSAPMLKEAERKLKDSDIKDLRSRASYVEGEVAFMPFQDEQFDAAGITFGIRNLIFENSQAEKHLSEIHRVLRKDGRLVILESSKPSFVPWRFINAIYLRFILPYLGGWISGNMDAYRYLARSSKNYYTIGEMNEILNGAGFRVLKDRPLFLGSVMLLVAQKV